MFDAPGKHIIIETQGAFLIARDTFKQYVRVRFDGVDFQHPHEEPLKGTRCSSKTDWHCVYYLKRDVDKGVPQWVKDDTASSNSQPTGTATAKGDADVTLLGGEETEGFTATYVENQETHRTWKLKGTKSTEVPVDDPDSTNRWEITIPNKVTVVITTTAGFNDGDVFKFTVFKTGDPRGKVNEIALGAFNTSDPDVP